MDNGNQEGINIKLNGGNVMLLKFTAFAVSCKLHSQHIYCNGLHGCISCNYCNCHIMDLNIWVSMRCSFILSERWNIRFKGNDITVCDLPTFWISTNFLNLNNGMIKYLMQEIELISKKKKIYECHAWFKAVYTVTKTPT